MRNGRLAIILVAAALTAAIAVGGGFVGGISAATAAENRFEPPLDPATGEAPGAPTGCCCYPKLNPTEKDRYDCKSKVTEFDCKAECSMFKDGRLPSGCKWTQGACQP